MSSIEQTRPRVIVPSSVPDAGIGVSARLRYWKRVASAYLGNRKSHLTFWHGTPQVNEDAEPGSIDLYWQRFAGKADYPGQFDAKGIPMLDYHGHVGLQYNPIAIAQYGLGNYNLFRRTDDRGRRDRFLAVAEWLVDNLEENDGGLLVWNHHFDWEYRTPLRSPWYSALSQGQGLSLLVRAHRETGEARYLEAARAALETFYHPLEDGGVSYWDREGRIWFEETVVDPPTHILNGYLWASWGIYDIALHTDDSRALALWEDAVETLSQCLGQFDLGYWSMYDLPGTRMRNPASWFYHALHIVQLRIMYRLTGKPVFQEFADRWDGYRNSWVKSKRATLHKILFKLNHY